MRVFNSFSEAQGIVKNAVVTTGMFDGVHIGHRSILNHLNQVARAVGGESLLISFHPHPREVLSKGQTPFSYLNTPEEKKELLLQTGLENLIIHTFTHDFSKTTPLQFLENILFGQLNAKAMVMGKNHYFGHNREGNFETVKQQAKRLGIVPYEIPLEYIDQETISSAKIRESIMRGDVELANSLLGYNYFLTGSIGISLQPEQEKMGNHNVFKFVLADSSKLLPQSGEYQVILINRNGRFLGLLSLHDKSNMKLRFGIQKQYSFGDTTDFCRLQFMAKA